MMPRSRVVIVGAGMAGLVAARSLTESFDVVVVDKGRGVGGRLATRRIGDASFDHGAQFITTHSSAFAAVLTGWEAAGVVRPWFTGRVGPEGIADPDGHTRFRGVTTMNAIAKHLAVGLDVRLSARVVALRQSDTGWSVRLEGGSELAADAVIVTAPVPQTTEMLAAGGATLSESDDQALRAVRYEPCLALLAALDGASGLDEPGAIAPASGPIAWMADNCCKGVSSVPAVTIHARAEFSRSHFESSDEIVIAELLRAADLAAQPIDGQVQVQRWRYARPTTIHPEACLVADGRPPLVFAGDAFGSAKVEGAALSGTAAAKAVATLLDGTEPNPTTLVGGDGP